MPCPAQTDPPRTDYVFHIYVDPLLGDNALATAYNPSTGSTTPAKKPLGRHPEPGNPQPITGFLQHAPYPFKTLTLSNGALA